VSSLKRVFKLELPHHLDDNKNDDDEPVLVSAPILERESQRKRSPNVLPHGKVDPDKKRQHDILDIALTE
jgi:hypothetical protein